MNSEVEETAKAAQEIAKTAGKAIEAGEKLGGFISKYIGGPIEQGMGIVEDKLKYMRWQRQVRLMQRATEFIQSVGLSEPIRAIPMKLAVPLLQAASLEENDYLQDMWARLLVKSATDSGFDLKRMYIDILERLTPFEAQLLEKIYELPFEETQHNQIRTDGLPKEATAGKEGATHDDWKEPPDEIKFALISLAHVGCISLGRTWGGGELFASINPTQLGKHFVESCKLK